MSTHRIAPGSTVTSAIAIVVDTLNIVESTIFTDPPCNGVACIWDDLNVYGNLAVPAGPTGALVSSGRGATYAMLSR